MDPLFWSAILMLLALVVAEILSPPPYGLIGFLAVVAAVAAIYMAFHYRGPVAGFSFVAVAVFGMPAAFLLGIKYWPHTSMGRHVMLEAPIGDDMLPDADPRRHLPQLIGKAGQAKTVMLPGGAVSIDGRTYEAVSEGMPIESGDPVCVVQVRHNRLVVRKLDGPLRPADPQDPLSQPAESLGLDPFDEPLG
ncbi:MAG: hypothetical protein K8T25_00890 [Planctomycetia bacterium]|nr:hypothetical protein [Planctomycetia bacterium]